MPTVRISPPRRPATEAEVHAIRKLRRCRFAPGTSEKRFIMGFPLDSEPQITEKQAEWLGKILHRYRKQLEAIARTEGR